VPDLSFQIRGVETAVRGITPLLRFKLRVDAKPANEAIAALLISAQIQLQCPQRRYSPAEQEKLVDLFGPPEGWGRTLRNRLWVHSNATVGQFTGVAETFLPVPCTYDLNVAAAKYFYALESGEVSLLFLFSGSIFYTTEQAGLQVAPISWNKECVYRMPVRIWKELMDQHYPNSAWLSLRRDVFDKLYAHKRRNGFATWEETIEHLLPDAEGSAGFAGSGPVTGVRGQSRSEVAQ
jgi:hypothetical protein